LFFLSVILNWDAALGQSIDRAYLFYCTDGISVVLFFNLAIVLTLFWAELYHISTGTEILYSYIVRPILLSINVIAYIVLISLIIYSEFSFSTIKYYFYDQNVTTEVVLYSIASFLFLIYSQCAIMEIKLAPIRLSVRRERVYSLRVISVLFITALVAKMVIALIFLNKNIDTDALQNEALILLYFITFEIIPMVAALWYYQHIPMKSIDDNTTLGETIPINLTSHHINPSPLRTFQRDSSFQQSHEDLINQIVGHLSMEEPNISDC
jgi:hypothetical protein